MRILSLLIVSLLFSSAFAGTIELTGEGFAERAPDFFKVTVTVTSMCYDSTQEAQTANRGLSQDIEEIFKLRKEKTAGSDYFASGSYTYRKTETDYVDGKNVTLCKNGYRASNTLTFKTTDLTSFSDLQDELFKKIDSFETESVVVKELSFKKTSANVSEPVKDLTRETRKAMQKEVYETAAADAMTQLEALVTACNLSNPRLVRIYPPETSDRRTNVYSRSAMEAAAAPGGGGETPVKFAPIPQEASLNFVFEIDGGMNGCVASSIPKQN